jgi:hypothetical protein
MSTSDDKLINHTLKLRNLAYYLPYNTSPNKPSPQGKTPREEEFGKTKAEIMYPTSLCEICKENVICDFFHLHSCLALYQEQKKLKETLNKTLEPITGFPDHNYYWNSRTERVFRTHTPTLQPKPSQKCICNSPEFGTYHLCSKCGQSFHLTCIGFSRPPNPNTPFVCHSCNPQNPALFQKERDWTKKRNCRRTPKPPKIHPEIILTQGLELSTPRNRAVYLHAQENLPSVENLASASKQLNNIPAVSMLKRACLGYIPKSLVKECFEKGKQRNIPRAKIKEALKTSNLLMIEGSHELYKTFIKLNRERRREEALYQKTNPQSQNFLSIPRHPKQAKGQQHLQ